MKSLRMIFLVVNCLAASRVFSQSMSTPYSVYGIGDIDNRIYNHNSGMGYTGLALKTSLFSSGNNPSSAAGLEKSYFVLDLSAAGRLVTYTGDDIDATNRQNRDFIIKKLALTAKINSFWASGIGFRQFSSVNYAFQGVKLIEGSNDSYIINYSGDGGINEYYWNNAFAINKHLSVGVTSSFVAGSVNQTETIANDLLSTAIVSKRQDYYANAKFDYGAIYTANINKKWNIAGGVSFSNKTDFPAERSVNLTDNTVAVIKDDIIKYTRFSLPRSYGAGLSLSSKKGITVAADYTFQDWNSLKIKGTGWDLVSSQRLSAGAEFATYKTSEWTKNTLKKAFQFGAYINDSYLRIGKKQIDEYGITAGITRCFRNGLLYTVSAEGGVRGTTASGLIKENFIQLSFNFSLRDFVFSKGHKYD